MTTSEIVIRSAVLTDLPALVALESSCFATDRLTKRSFRYHLQHTGNVFLVLEQRAEVVAYALVFLRRGTSLARLYSMAVSPACHGQGIGRRLLTRAESESAERGCMFMRLEVRPDNEAAIRLYQQLGYRTFGQYIDYYEDHANALRLQKRIIAHGRQEEHLAEQDERVPFYAQTTDFTCGAASLMMAMKTLREDAPFDQRTEIQIWREATTIFMTSGHGGCGPHGLAYAASKRGFAAEVYVNQATALFVEGVRSEGKKEILELVHHDFLEKLHEHNVVVHHDVLSLDAMAGILQQHGLLLVLISTYRLDQQKAPHWVILVDMDDQFVYINDPDLEDDEPDPLDKHYLPIPRASFEKMLQFGQNRLRCSVVIR